MPASVLRFSSTQVSSETQKVANTPNAMQHLSVCRQAIKSFLGRVVLFVCLIPVAVIGSLLCFAFFVVKWVVIMACEADLLYQFFRMLYYWHTPGMHPGWTLLLHYGVITAAWTALYSLALLLPSSGPTPNNNVRETKKRRNYWKPMALWLLFRSNRSRY